MCDKCVGEPIELELRSTATAEQLWQRWQVMCRLSEEIGKRSTDKGRQWRNATDPDVKHALWSDYMAMDRDYQVIVAWRELMYSAYIFATRGADSEFMDDFFVQQEIGSSR